MAHHIENYIAYSYGTSAKARVPLVDPQKEIPEMKNRVYIRKKKIVRVNCGAIFGIALSFAMFYLIISGAAEYVNAAKELEQTEYVYEYVCERNVALNEEYENCNFDAIKKMATDMGMISIKEAEYVKIKLEEPKEEQKLSFMQDAVNRFVDMFGADPVFVLEK